MGDIAEIDVTPTGFLRTAAQTAKQVIMQRIREAEQGKIYDEYSEKENEILTAIVQRVEPKGVYVELGRTEGILPDSEWMPGEELPYRRPHQGLCTGGQPHRTRNARAARRCASAASIPGW